MPRHPRRRPGTLAVMAAAALALAGCGKSLDELLNNSQINALSATPNPVPAPAPGGATAFTLSVDIDSNRSDDDLIVYARNPADSGRYTMIAFVDACGTFEDNCGITTRTIPCFSRSQANRGDRRFVECGVGGVELQPGSHTLRVEITSCDSVFGCNRSPDDSAEMTLTVQ